MNGLDASEVAQLAADVPRERPPSLLYQGAWDQIEHARQVKGYSTNLDDEGNDPVQKWAGFSRSTYFVYKAKASIPLHIFARLLARLGLKYQLAVRPIRGYSKGTTSAPEVVVMRDTDEARKAADTINGFDDPLVRKDLLIAVQNEALKHIHPPVPPSPAVVIPNNGR